MGKNNDKDKDKSEGKKITGQDIRDIIASNPDPSYLESLDDNGDYFSDSARSEIDSYTSNYYASQQTSAAAAVADVISGTAASTAPVIDNTFDAAQNTVEVPLDWGAIYSGLSPDLISGWGLSTSTLDGLSVADRDEAVEIANKGIDYQTSYGLAELQGEIQKELDALKYENDQLSLDKTIKADRYLNRNDNLASTKNTRINAASQMLSNV